MIKKSMSAKQTVFTQSWDQAIAKTTTKADNKAPAKVEEAMAEKPKRISPSTNYRLEKTSEVATKTKIEESQSTAFTAIRCKPPITTKPKVSEPTAVRPTPQMEPESPRLVFSKRRRTRKDQL